MKTNNLYRRELEAARRLFGWIDRHPYLTNVIIATQAVIFALYVFLYYPI